MILKHDPEVRLAGASDMSDMPGREVAEWEDPTPSPAPASPRQVKNQATCPKCRKAHGLTDVRHAAGFKHVFKPLASLQERRAKRERAGRKAHHKAYPTAEARAALAALPVACQITLAPGRAHAALNRYQLPDGLPSHGALTIRSLRAWDCKKLKPVSA